MKKADACNHDKRSKVSQHDVIFYFLKSCTVLKVLFVLITINKDLE